MITALDYIANRMENEFEMTLYKTKRAEYVSYTLLREVPSTPLRIKITINECTDDYIKTHFPKKEYLHNPFGEILEEYEEKVKRAQELNVPLYNIDAILYDERDNCELSSIGFLEYDPNELLNGNVYLRISDWFIEVKDTSTPIYIDTNEKPF